MYRFVACWLWWQSQFPCSCFVPPIFSDFPYLVCNLSSCPRVSNDIATLLVDFKVEHIRHIKLVYILVTFYIWIPCLKWNSCKYWNSRGKILELPGYYVSSSHLSGSILHIDDFTWETRKQMRASSALRRAAERTWAISSGLAIAVWSPSRTDLPCAAPRNLHSPAYTPCLACTTRLNVDLIHFRSLSGFVYGSEAARGGWRSLQFFTLVLAIGSRSRTMWATFIKYD